MRETILRWFGHVKEVWMLRCERINIRKGKRGRRRPKKTLDEMIREELKVARLKEDMTQDRRL